MGNWIILVVLAGLVAFAGVEAIQIVGHKADMAGSAVATSSGSLDMSDWTEDEKMMYEHHGTVPARFQKSAAPAPQPSAMVGGC